MSESWIEPRTRIPFVGIVAMVIIVAVVAIFMKSQLSPLFPSSDVKVETAAGTGNVVGRASASFYGQREVQLSANEYLIGVLSTTGRSITLTVDPTTKVLVITDGSQREEVQLRQENSELKAFFEFYGVETTVVIDPARKFMIYNEPGKSIGAINLPLSESIAYQGFFTVRNRQYLVIFHPAQSKALIVGSTSDSVALTSSGTTYSGVWDEAGKEHPLTINTANMLATIDEVY